MTLIDLEELTLRVRDPFSKRYYAEAIRSYQAGAYRAAIMSVWIAVVYDIISKIRELQAQGDSAANVFITKLDRAVTNNNVPHLQKIEKGILETSRDNFEFISNQEYEDLRRLMADRHRCAHPAFNEENALFEPTAELVRAHLRHAVLHLLHHQPVQGKSALLRIKADVVRASFPTEAEEARMFLEKKYLSHAKDSLVRNLVIVMLKALLRQDDPVILGKEEKAINTLLAVRSTHPEIYQPTVEQQVNSIADTLDDPKLVNLIRLIGADNQIWDRLQDPNRLRVENFIRNHKFPVGGIEVVLAVAAVIDDLREQFIDGFTRIPTERQMELIEVHPNPLFDQVAPKLYLEKSSNFRSAEEIATKVVLPMIPHFHAHGIVAVLDAVRCNDQIRHAAGTPSIIEKLFEERIDLLTATSAKWKEFAEWLLEDEKPEDYYSYPNLREKMQDHKINIEIPVPDEEEEDSENELPF